MKRHPLHVLHSKKRTSLIFAHFIHGDDIRMAKRGSCFGFSLKSSDGVRVRQVLSGEKFQSDPTA